MRESERMHIEPIAGYPDASDYRNRATLLDAALLESVPCRANALAAELLKQQREQGICQITLLLKD